MTDLIVNFSSYLALGRAGVTGLSRGGAAPPSSHLLDGAGAALRAMDSSRGGIDEIKAGLMKLRDTLQAARAQADAVPGRTELKAVVANIEDTVDQPTFVTINGQPVQSGTITAYRGTRPVVVGYEWTNRASLEVGDALKSLTANVSALVSAVGADGTDGFAADVSALLRSSDFTTAVNTPDVAAIDAATARIDAVLSKAEGLKLSLATRASAAALVDLGGLLLGANPNLVGGTAGIGSDSPYAAYSSSASGAKTASGA